MRFLYDGFMVFSSGGAICKKAIKDYRLKIEDKIFNLYGNDSADFVIPTKVGIQFFTTCQIEIAKTLLKLAYGSKT